MGAAKGQHAMASAAAGDMAHHPHSRSQHSHGPSVPIASLAGSGAAADAGDGGSEDGYRQGAKDSLPPR